MHRERCNRNNVLFALLPDGLKSVGVGEGGGLITRILRYTQLFAAISCCRLPHTHKQRGIRSYIYPVKHDENIVAQWQSNPNTVPLCAFHSKKRLVSVLSGI